MAILIILSIIAIMISLVSMVLSYKSYKRSGKMKKIESYLQYGAPEEINLQIEHEKQDLEEQLQRIDHKYNRMKKAAETEFARRNMIGKPLKQMLQKIEHEEMEKIKRAQKTTERNIELLELKKSYLEKL